jgi:hypothetical protein
MIRRVLRGSARRERAGQVARGVPLEFAEAIALSLEPGREESLRAVPDASHELVVVG